MFYQLNSGYWATFFKQKSSNVGLATAVQAQRGTGNASNSGITRMSITSMAIWFTEQYTQGEWSIACYAAF